MIWYLLVTMIFKHLVADYFLQGEYMKGKFKKVGWALPLAAHCGVHFLFTMAITLMATGGIGWAILFAVIDFTIHFAMDKIKVDTRLLGRWQALSKNEYIGLMDSKAMCVDGLRLLKDGPAKDECQRRINEIDERFASNVKFWYAHGVDQAVHHLTDLLIVALIMSVL